MTSPYPLEAQTAISNWLAENVCYETTFGTAAMRPEPPLKVAHDALMALSAAGFTVVPTGLVEAARELELSLRCFVYDDPPTDADAERLAAHLAQLDVPLICEGCGRHLPCRHCEEGRG